MDTIFNIIICDDDYAFSEKLHTQVSGIMQKNGFDYAIKTVYDGDELIEYCSKNITDVILVDIDMPNIDGFQAIKELQKSQPDLKVIFVTAHEEYAFQAYDYQPFWFVSKRKLEKLDEVLVKLIQILKHRKEFQETVHIHLDKIYDINVNEIVYFKSDRHYVLAYDHNQNITKYRCGLREIYEQLKSSGYIYVQQRYVVNCRYIEKFDSRYITLKDDSETKISVTRDAKIMMEAQRLYSQFRRGYK